MSPKPKPEPDDKEQSQRFIDAARELEADESDEQFEKAFRATVPPAKLKQEKEEPEND